VATHQQDAARRSAGVPPAFSSGGRDARAAKIKGVIKNAEKPNDDDRLEAMKTRALLSSRLVRFGLPTMLFVSWLAVQQWRKHALYPTSSVMINYATGKPAPLLADFLLPITTDDGYTVVVSLGNFPGDVVEDTVLGYLSSTILMRPAAREFHFTWSVRGGSGEDNVELVYSRQDRNIIEINHFGDNSKSSRILLENITDRDIHGAAKNEEKHQPWGYLNWSFYTKRHQQ